MILVDPRVGSEHLTAALTALGVTAVTSPDNLTIGDAIVFGVGPGGVPATVLVELKRLGDCLRCIQDGRFAGSQAHDLRAASEAPPYLIVEGDVRRGPQGELLKRHGKEWRPVNYGGRSSWQYDALEHWKMTMALKGGFQVITTKSEKDTAVFLASLDRWWNAGWDSHTSHRSLDTSMNAKAKWTQLELANLNKPTTAQRILKELPSLGWKLAELVAKHFKTARRACNATAAEYMEIEGIGKKKAEQIDAAWDSEE